MLVLVVLIVALSILSPYFLSVSNFLNILLATSVIGVLAFGATFVIAAAGIDLSLGSVLALSGVVGALSVNALNLPWPVAHRRLPRGRRVLRPDQRRAQSPRPASRPSSSRSACSASRAALGLVLTNGQPVYGLPDPIVFLGQGRPFGVPMPVFIFLAVAIVAHFVLAYTRFGKYAQVIGDNEGAARAMGIQVDRHRIALYVAVGRCSPASPASCSWRGSIPATRPPASTTS